MDSKSSQQLRSDGTMLPSSLRSKRVILASASPRRKEILTTLGLKPEIIPSTFEETLDKAQFSTPDEYVLATASGKANEVFQRVSSSSKDNNKEKKGDEDSLLVIAADTIVVLGSEILEKPASEQHAKEMLSKLSGKAHHVLTAVILVDSSSTNDSEERTKEPRTWKFVERTEVVFANLSEDEIDAYVATGEPMDKAGGYGYQTGAGSVLVERITGCFYNVVGFPSGRFVRELRNFVGTG